MGRDGEVAALAAALNRPGLVVVAAAAGAGKTTVARCAARRAGFAVLDAGALATLRHVPGLPLARAIRAKVPVDDAALAVEAVRARLGDMVLLLDDAHWADRFTLGLLPELARHCRIVATVRTPGPLTDAALKALRRTATLWLDLPALPTDAAVDLVRSVRTDLPDGTVRRIVERAGGNPLALRVLAEAGTEPPPAGALRSVAEMVADLPQDERTALAALGLLGRPAPAALLGHGGAALVRRGLVTSDDAGTTLRPQARIVAEVAAGVLPDALRRDMHRRLAALLDDDAEAARHLAAAGDGPAAAARALRAARSAPTAGARAEQFLVAIGCLSGRADTAVVLEAADAALDAGLVVEAVRLVEPLTPVGATERVHRAVVLAEALTRSAAPDEAAQRLREVAADLADVDQRLSIRHAVASVYAALADDPEVACALAEFPLAELGAAAPPRLRAAYGAALLAARRPGWEEPVRTAVAAARADGDLAEECAAGAVLVAGLRDGCRFGEAREVATELAERCAAQAAYSVEVAFRAEALWADLHVTGVGDELVRRAGTMLDRATPAGARTLLVAVLALAQADAGAVPAARGLLRDETARRDRLVRWVAAETAWLDGDDTGAERLAAELLTAPGPSGSEADLPAGPPADLPADLARLTRAWCAADQGRPLPDGAGERPQVSLTLRAVSTADPLGLVEAAQAWEGVMARERVRCLLAAGEAGGEVSYLLQAEHVAEQAGLVLLLGRVRRALRRHGVVRRPARPTGPGGLSAREYEVLALVGQGHGTRRIAELLGLSRNTTETYIKQAMGKLGARTRTEAAVRAADLARQEAGRGPGPGSDARTDPPVTPPAVDGER